jgi:hypothetical protein
MHFGDIGGNSFPWLSAHDGRIGVSPTIAQPDHGNAKWSIIDKIASASETIADGSTSLLFILGLPSEVSCPLQARPGGAPKKQRKKMVICSDAWTYRADRTA